MLGSLFARLSTGVKMLIILSAALLPLGLIAVVASMQSNETARATRHGEARAMLTAVSRLLSDRIDDDLASVRRAAVGIAGRDPIACRSALAPLVAQGRGSFALLDRTGQLVCNAGVQAIPSAAQLPERTDARVDLPGNGRVRFAARIVRGGGIAVGEYDGELARRSVRPVLADSYVVRIRDGQRELQLNGSAGNGDRQGQAVASAVGAGPARVELLLVGPPISAAEVLTALLPILMWLAAALIGWLVVDRIILHPLGGMQRAIAGYRAGDGPLVLPNLTTPALELRTLGEAFRQVTARVTAHEAQLEEGLARQIRLTREVHHRVKNNLQVVSSLINLHARGAEDPAVINAYASIQRRVDALAVVHRNHYAELEENRGVGLRALIGELAANLRATAPPRAAHLAVTLDLMPAYASQDTAVPVAFLITEIVELAMECDPDGRVAITLTPLENPARALLTIIAPGLADELCRDHPSMGRFTRVTEGLSRQLRSKLRREGHGTQIMIEIAIIPAGPTEN